MYEYEKSLMSSKLKIGIGTIPKKAINSQMIRVNA